MDQQVRVFIQKCISAVGALVIKRFLFVLWKRGSAKINLFSRISLSVLK